MRTGCTSPVFSVEYSSCFERTTRHFGRHIRTNGHGKESLSRVDSMMRAGYFSVTARTLHQRRDRGLQLPGLAGAVFPPNEPLVDVLTCARVMADAQGGVVVVASVYGMPQVLVPVRCCCDSLRGAQRFTASRCAQLGQSSQPVHFFVLCRGRWG